MLHENTLPGACWGESCDSPFFAQNATNLVVHVLLMFSKCFVHLLHEVDFTGHFRQGLSALFNAEFDCLACFDEQKNFFCSEILQMYSRNGLVEV